MIREKTGVFSQENTYFNRLKRISWGAVFAGAVIAVVVQLTFSIMGLGIGIGTIEPMQEGQAIQGLGVGSLVWWVVTNLISLFIGGWVAGRLAGIPRAFDSILHGALTWGVYTLFSFYLITTTIGSIIGGVGGAIGRTLEVAGRGIAQAAPELADPIMEELERRGITLDTIRQEGREAIRDIDREKLEQQARATGDDIKRAVSRVAIFLSIGMILGAVVASTGGKVGEPHDLDSTAGTDVVV